MKMPSHVYKVSIVLCNSKRKKICLQRDWEGIVQAKDEYNARHANKIFLLKPCMDRLNLLYGSSGKSKNTFDDALLKPFVETLTGELYRVKNNDENGFTLKASQLISPWEVAILLNDLRYKEPVYFNFNDYCLLLPTYKGEQDDEEDKEEHRHKRQGDKRFDYNGKDIERLTFDETLECLNSLVGMDIFKEETRKVVNIAENFKNKGEKDSVNAPLPYAYFVTIEKGMGITTILKLMANVFYHLKITASRKMFELDPDQTGFFLSRYRNNLADPGYGLIGIYDLACIKDKDPNDEKFIMKAAKTARDKIFFFIFTPEQEKKRERYKKIISQYLHIRSLDIPAFKEEELLEIARRKLDAYNCELNHDAEKKLQELIVSKREQGTFENIRTIDSIALNGFMNKLFESDSKQPAGDEDKMHLDVSNLQLGETVQCVPWQESEGLQELESLIGLKSVKEKVREIIQHLLLVKKGGKMGISKEKMSLHMLFTGNPGTGKTTVARLIGKIFREVGLLEKGGFQEVSREHMVARYVGHTALKTTELVNDNLGNVLFVDEAYSLNDGSSTNFGQEALDTLVRQMENNRDKIVIVLAGYTDEMKSLMERNPGLKDRIPHRIDFPDYNGEELLQIFHHILEEECHVNKDAENELAVLLHNARKNRDKHFGNGRFVRNIVERIKLKQAKRVYIDGDLDTEAMLTITLEDVQALYEDKDILEQIKKEGRAGKQIGF